MFNCCCAFNGGCALRLLFVVCCPVSVINCVLIDVCGLLFIVVCCVVCCVLLASGFNI